MTELQSFYRSAILHDGPVPYHVMQKSESSFNSTGSSHFMLYTMNRLLTPELFNLEYDDRLSALNLPSLSYRRHRADVDGVQYFTWQCQLTV